MTANPHALVLTAASFAVGSSLAIGAAVTAGAVSACDSGNSNTYILPNDASVEDSAISGTIAFTVGASLSVTVSTSVTIAVDTGQDGPITWWLDGAYADASLADTTTNAVGGKASIVLRATSAAAAFTLHARTAGGATASLAITVPGPAFVTLDVHPDYSGMRVAQTGAVVASIFVDTTCAALSGQTIVDGTLVTSGTIDGSIEIAGVPTGVAVAVGVRIGHFAFGCADFKSGTDVTVQIVDRLAMFDQTDLVLDFSPTPSAAESASFVAILDRARQHADVAFGADSDEPRPLLDAMATAAAANGQMSAFDAARQANGWDAKTATWLGAHPTLVGDQLDPWLTAAETRGLGDLLLHLRDASGGAAPTSVVSLSNIGTTKTGLAVLGPFLWSADTHDDVTLNGAMVLNASQLLTSLTAPASGSGDVPSALAAAIDCTGLGARLANGGVSYAGCDASCTASLCSQALIAMWAAAAAGSQSASDPTELALSVAGSPVLDDTAHVVQFSGAGKVQLRDSTGNSTISGMFSTVPAR